MYLGYLKIHCTLPEQHEKADAAGTCTWHDFSNWDKILVDFVVLNKIYFSNTISFKKLLYFNPNIVNVIKQKSIKHEEGPKATTQFSLIYNNRLIKWNQKHQAQTGRQELLTATF